MVITIGAFDGFHKGHAELFRKCREISSDWGVVTFEPHPAEFMGRIKPLFRLKEKKLLGKFLGIPEICVLKFDEALKNLTPEKFWDFLKSKIEVDGLVIGSDFHFGHGRSGNAELICELAVADGISRSRVITVDLVNKSEYSSSALRQLVSTGNVRKASELLGYPFFIVSRVIHGDERGRTMGIPTANLEVDEGRVIPADGVYSCAVRAKGEYRCGAVSIGNNPTFNLEGTLIEVHLPGFNGDIYGEEITVMFLERLRGMRKFSGKEELILQIQKDIDESRRGFSEFGEYVYRHTLPLEQ